MIYGYIRVSTNHQDGENQKVGIESFALSRQMKIDKFIRDKGQSGTVEPEKRELGMLMNELIAGDILITSELSRLGRTLFMIMRILEFCMETGVRVYTVKEGYELGDNIQSKVLAFAFGISAEIERTLISQRTKEALEKRRQEGYRLGKKRGERERLNPTCEQNRTKIESALKECVPKKQIARSLGIGINALYRYLAYTGLYTPKSAQNEDWTKWGIFR